MFAGALRIGIEKGNSSALRQNLWTKKAVCRTQNSVQYCQKAWANLSWFSNKSFWSPMDASSLITALGPSNQATQICRCSSVAVILDVTFWTFIHVTYTGRARTGSPTASHNNKIIFVLKYQNHYLIWLLSLEKFLEILQVYTYLPSLYLEKAASQFQGGKSWHRRQWNTIAEIAVWQHRNLKQHLHCCCSIFLS